MEMAISTDQYSFLYLELFNVPSLYTAVLGSWMYQLKRIYTNIIGPILQQIPNAILGIDFNLHIVVIGVGRAHKHLKSLS